MNQRVCALFLFSMLAAMGGISMIPPSRVPDNAGIEAYVQAQVRAWNIPGAALVIVQNGQVAHLQTFGQAGRGRPVTSQTPFEIGSCSKSFTALAIMQLVEDGRVELDTPVQRYLPWFRVADTAASADITIRHLLNHTSGLPESTNAPLWVNPRGLTLEDWGRSLHNQALSAAPGTRYQYGNLNYMLLALIIETVSGQSYGAYLSQHIFSPLDMQNSFTDPGRARTQGLSDGHTWWFGVPLPSLEGPRLDMLGAGYLMVSPEDMSHYLVAQLNGGVYENTRVLSTEGVATMHTPSQLPAGESEYGMGWVSYQENGQTMINHNGRSASFTSAIILLPEQKTGIAVMVNTSSTLAPHAAWSLASNVKNMLVFDQPGQVDPSFRDFYLRWNGGFLATTALVLWRLSELLRRSKAGARSVARRRSALSLAADGLLALAAFFGLPLALGGALWRGFFVYQPDAAYWCLIAGVLLLTKSILRIGGLVQDSRKR